MENKSTRLKTRTGEFNVAIDGPQDAPVLIFSNSLGTTLDMWQPQMDALAETYRVIRYDTRGHGGSVITTGPYRFSELGADVLALMDTLTIEKAAFCGVSMGGHTGLWLAAHAPERFSHFIVCNTAAKIGTAEAWNERASLVRQGGQTAMDQLAQTSPERWFSPDFIANSPEMVATAQAWVRSIDAEGYAACCEALAESDLRQDLAKITTATLVVGGTEDPVTTMADAQYMQQHIVGAELEAIQASHLSNIEGATAFNRAVLQFLNTKNT